MMKVKQKDVIAALAYLRKKGLTDEQIAVGIGQQMPGGAHPSSMSVYRWRIGKNKPRQMFGWVILEMAKVQRSNT
jgi:hypothetical protein